MSANDPKRSFVRGFCCNAQRHTSSDVLSYKFLCLGEPMRRREFINIFGSAVFSWPLAARAQRTAGLASEQRASAPRSSRPGGP